MTTPTLNLSQCAPLKNIDVEQRLEKKLNGVISFNNPIKNSKELITYSKDKNNKRKMKLKTTEC